MRERVSMLGGALAAGAEPDGGYTVRAVLPLSDDGKPA
jgi:signal transduction histidine kinase